MIDFSKRKPTTKAPTTAPQAASLYRNIGRGTIPENPNARQINWGHIRQSARAPQLKTDGLFQQNQFYRGAADTDSGKFTYFTGDPEKDQWIEQYHQQKHWHIPADDYAPGWAPWNV